MKKITIVCLFFLLLSMSAYCGQMNKIELNDGSVINGEIVSFANGLYTIKTDTLGEIKLEQSKISQISSAGQPGSLNQPAIDSYKQKILGNPENTAIISGLANDSQIQDMANDPQIQEAVKSGDIQALMKNKKFMDIVNNPKMQDTIKKLKK